MYDIDLDSAFPVDVIKRSLVCHPSLLREALERQANESRNAGALFGDNAKRSRTPDEWKKGEQASKGRGALCTSMVQMIDSMNFDESEQVAKDICLLGVGAMIIALNESCRLQAIPPQTRTAIATRSPL